MLKPHGTRRCNPLERLTTCRRPSPVSLSLSWPSPAAVLSSSYRRSYHSFSHSRRRRRFPPPVTSVQHALVPSWCILAGPLALLTPCPSLCLARLACPSGAVQRAYAPPVPALCPKPIARHLSPPPQPCRRACHTMVPFRASQHHRRSLRDLDAGFDPGRLQREERSTYDLVMTFPVHPLAAMQGPFEESMLDATGSTGFVPFKKPKKTIDQRQHMLCREHDAPELTWNYTYNCHWRNKSKGKYHPLLKTVAQVIFGVHLLHQHLEKSVADVADILLKHVNELDSFLQRANEDIEGSLKDMLFRRKCLKVPMEHVNEFDRLLDDRTYRFQLLEGNVTIERTINRMSQMLNDYLADIDTFQKSNQQLDAYLLQIGHNWTAMDGDIGRIYSAMCGNTAGWAQFLQSLVAKAEKLGVVLMQVSSYCNEIEKRCGAASRRSMVRAPLPWSTRRSFPNFCMLPFHQFVAPANVSCLHRWPADPHHAIPRIREKPPVRSET